MSSSQSTSCAEEEELLDFKPLPVPYDVQTQDLISCTYVFKGGTCFWGWFHVAWLVPGDLKNVLLLVLKGSYL